MSIQQTVVWSRVDQPGTEILGLIADDDGIVAKGTVLSVDASGEPYTLRYSLRCDPDWQVRRVQLRVELGGRAKSLQLRFDPETGWRIGRRQATDEYADCRDMDLSATPFTNSLPIRRLRLPVGGSREVAVVYVNLPGLSVSRSLQRYTHVESYRELDRYLYESVQGGFRAELEVDTDGLVIEYPGLFTRFNPGGKTF